MHTMVIQTICSRYFCAFPVLSDRRAITVIVFQLYIISHSISLFTKVFQL